MVQAPEAVERSGHFNLRFTRGLWRLRLWPIRTTCLCSWRRWRGLFGHFIHCRMIAKTPIAISALA